MGKSVLTFSAPEIKDYSTIKELLFHVEQSDLAFPNLFLLQKKYGTQIALYKNSLYRYFSGTGRLQGYTFPVGEINDIEKALFHVEQHAKEHGNPLLYCLLTEENARILQQVYGDKICFQNDPGDADYLYKRADLAELPGTIFHKKRNHIARFNRCHEGWKFVPMNGKNCADALSVAHAWVQGQEVQEAHLHELNAIEKAINQHAELGIIGGILYVEQRPVAMSLASYINPSVADIHYEKCVPKYRDAYPIINQEMAKMLTCDFINREEDLNIPGLRQAKLSYKPSHILQKLKASISLC